MTNEAIIDIAGEDDFLNQVCVFGVRPVVYRYHDAGGNLLYIGASKNIGGRTSEHAKRSPWFAESTRLHITVYPTWEDAYEAEQAEIKSRKPLYNRRKRRSPPDRSTPLQINKYCEVCGAPFVAAQSRTTVCSGRCRMRRKRSREKAE